MPGIKNPFAKTMVMDLAGKEVGLAAAWATQPTVPSSPFSRRISISLFSLLSYSPFNLRLLVSCPDLFLSVLFPNSSF
jgi:hypothetical protein